MALRFDPIMEAGRNWDANGWAQVDAMMAATSLTRVHQVMLARIDAALAPLDLNFSRFEVLALLSFSREGQLPMGKIGDRLQVHAASVTNTITRLESSGLVQRKPHPVDGRTTLARILGQGRQRARQGAAVLAGIDFGLTGMDPADRIQLSMMLTRYRIANEDFR